MSTLTSLENLRAQNFLELTLKSKVGVRYSLYRKEKHKQQEVMRADIVCVRRGQNHDIWNFGWFGFQAEVNSSVDVKFFRSRKHDVHFATGDRNILIRDGISEVLKDWEQEVAKGLHPKHAPAQPEWLNVEVPFVGVMIVGNERNELPASSSHWMLYHGLVMATFIEFGKVVCFEDGDTRDTWLEDILWTINERFGAFVTQNRNELAERVFAG